MVSNQQRARRRAAARQTVEAPTTEQPTEQPTETTAEPTETTEQPTTEAPTETPAKAKRTRTRTPKVVPEPEPEPEDEAPARTYTAWVPPATKEEALVMLRPAKGRGLIQELQQAHDRVKTNRERKDAGPKAPNTIQAIGWHDRTMAKVLIACNIANTAAYKREAQELLERSQKHTGFGTKTAITRPGKAAFAAMEAANSRKRPARRTATAKEVAA